MVGVRMLRAAFLTALCCFLSVSSCLYDMSSHQVDVLDVDHFITKVTQNGRWLNYSHPVLVGISQDGENIVEHYVNLTCNNLEDAKAQLEEAAQELYQVKTPKGYTDLLWAPQLAAHGFPAENVKPSSNEPSKETVSRLVKNILTFRLDKAFPQFLGDILIPYGLNYIDSWFGPKAVEDCYEFGAYYPFAASVEEPLGYVTVRTGVRGRACDAVVAKSLMERTLLWAQKEEKRNYSFVHMALGFTNEPWHACVKLDRSFRWAVECPFPSTYTDNCFHGCWEELPDFETLLKEDEEPVKDEL